MNGNAFMSWLLRSPFHGMLSKGMMLITVTGRKTGKKYTTPVGFYRDNAELWVLSSRDRTWWKNLQGGAQVSLLLQRKAVNAFAAPELETKMVEALMHEYIRRIPHAAKPMGIRMENGNANPSDIARLAQERLFIRIKPA
jgi:deazaflavin-dependent oxidoreductase (nitroreductase family)